MMTSKHVWRKCDGHYYCTAFLKTKNVRCFEEAVVHCVRVSHSDRFEPHGGCEAKCRRHAPKRKTKKVAAK